jgi:hypothetical protein
MLRNQIPRSAGLCNDPMDCAPPTRAISISANDQPLRATLPNTRPTCPTHHVSLTVARPFQLPKLHVDRQSISSPLRLPGSHAKRSNVTVSLSLPLSTESPRHIQKYCTTVFNGRNCTYRRRSRMGIIESGNNISDKSSTSSKGGLGGRSLVVRLVWI